MNSSKQQVAMDAWRAHWRRIVMEFAGSGLSLRGVAVGRRNWTFSGSGGGGRTAAVLTSSTSFTAACQRLKINPFAYLHDVLGRIAEHPMTKLDDLLPDNWKPVGAWDRSPKTV